MNVTTFPEPLTSLLAETSFYCNGIVSCFTSMLHRVKFFFLISQIELLTKPTLFKLQFIVGIYCSFFDFKINLPNYDNMLFDQKYSKFVDNLVGMNQHIQRTNIYLLIELQLGTVTILLSPVENKRQPS